MVRVTSNIVFSWTSLSFVLVPLQRKGWFEFERLKLWTFVCQTERDLDVRNKSTLIEFTFYLSYKTDIWCWSLNGKASGPVYFILQKLQNKLTICAGHVLLIIHSANLCVLFKLMDFCVSLWSGNLLLRISVCHCEAEIYDSECLHLDGMLLEQLWRLRQHLDGMVLEQLWCLRNRLDGMLLEQLWCLTHRLRVRSNRMANSKAH